MNHISLYSQRFFFFYSPMSTTLTEATFEWSRGERQNAIIKLFAIFAVLQQ